MQQGTRDVQNKILEIIKFIDELCRKNDIDYFIIGGTALGAVRHGGFIPWDDDLDIFMTPDNYMKFKTVFEEINSDKFVLQEWKIVDEYLEYAKVRMNGTTLIENIYKERKDMHHGIFVDIMILHKCPQNTFLQRLIYYMTKYVTLVALSQRNWKPKTSVQKLALLILKFLPNKILSKLSYKFIYSTQKLKKDFSYCYFFWNSKLSRGIFEREMFEKPVDIAFENLMLKAPRNIHKYLERTYGDYMKLPSLEERKASIHAEIFDAYKGFEHYI